MLEVLTLLLLDPMFGPLIILPLAFIVSYALWSILMRARNKIGPFRHIVNGLAFVGVIVHELSHFLICKLLGVPTDKIRVKLLDEVTRQVNPHGSVSLKNDKKMSFMQNFMVTFAPVYISTWLFFWSLAIVLTPSFDDFIRVLAGLFCASLLMGAAPSHQDFVTMVASFKSDPRYSMYQIFLVLLSGLSVWLITTYYNIMLAFNFLYFVIIGFLYFILKYLFRSINKLIFLSRSEGLSTSNRVKLGAFTRKRFKPAKPYKLGIEEPHW